MKNGIKSLIALFFVSISFLLGVKFNEEDYDNRTRTLKCANFGLKREVSKLKDSLRVLNGKMSEITNRRERKVVDPHYSSAHRQDRN